MNRRDFMHKSLAVGSAGLALSNSALAATSVLIPDAHGNAKAAPKHKFKLKYAPHFGMFKNLAGDDVISQLRFMADQGFTAVEDNGMMGRPVAEQEKIGNELAKLGMTMGVFVLDKGGNGANSLAAGKQEHLDIFLNGCRKAVEVAKRVNTKWTTVVPGDFVRNLPIGIQTGHVIEALRRGTEILEPAGLVMVLEPLSDTPNLFLRNSDQTYMICKAVNSPSCKILFDFYHMQKNEGRLIYNMDLCWDEIGYLQVGDEPGRKEPGTGEINYRYLFKHVYEKGYKGLLGMEHGNSQPDKKGEQAVIDAYALADGFVV
ncbi:hydroxypyruvate isomerase family protein [Adhaeribacter aquaticus]|uniref:hydroxypyruvate isomerase family protein n=1 Tax=Adhaeribacter aquaticus TaxID=299567 RepID=UPI00047ED665|nr:TIM barrel protein [Adhaeribacter aquaticus]